MGSLTGKTIFITGATSGFGLACATQCVREGARVVIAGRRKDRLDALAQELGDAAHAVALDVRDAAAVQAAFAGLPAGFAQPDALVNNAGLALGAQPFEQQPQAFLDEMVDTNIKGLMYCTQAALPGMIARAKINPERWGHIVNIGSVAGQYPYAGGNAYGGTKAFVAQFSMNLRCDLLGRNIRVSVIEPGMADTEFSLVRFQGDSSKAAAVYQGVEALAACDIADAIVWCLTRPAHVNVNRLEVMPTQQAPAGFAVHRKN
jgi:3-hydroxy acid dehydrogenase/malonic semialdehyde reductase